MSYKVAVSVGHNPVKQGYSTDKFSEYSEMAMLAGLLVSRLQRLGCRAYIIGTGSLSKKVSDINNLKCDAAIELHLNAGGGHGHETLYYPGSIKGKALAQIVNHAIQIAMENRDRGVKEGYYNMGPTSPPDYFLRETNCTAIIAEPFFLDNKNERSMYVGNLSCYSALATNIAVSIIKHLEEHEEWS